MNGKALAAIALALLAGTAGYVTHRASQRAPAAAAEALAAAPAAADPAAPLDWSFQNIDGTTTPLSAWRGRILVVNFWATWCPPCLHEIPIFIELQREHGAAGLQVVGVALDQVEAVRPFAAEHGLNYPILFGDDDVARYMLALGNDIGALPFTVVFSRDGRIAVSHRGEWDAEAAAAALKSLLEAP